MSPSGLDAEHGQQHQQHQRRLRADREQQRDRQHCAEAGAEQVEKVDAARGAAAAGEREADAAGREEKRYEERQVDERQVEELAAVPDDLQRVERHALREDETADHRYAEEQRAARERLLEARLQPAAQQRDERAARAVAQ
jgi:hypothetical protein